MNNVAEHAIPWPIAARPRVRRRAATPAKRRFHCRDARWPAVAAALDGLRAARRCSIRIVDAACGTGELLLCAVRHARALGFTAIEARGIDAAPALVDRARAAAAGVRDPGIGITFETADLVAALSEETDLPADILVWHGGKGCDATVGRAVAAAGRTLIADPADADGVRA
ncbi:SAM-dependent methyltransferase [Sphingomonas sp.]|uniref:SAM-dependent methyltransferase n=1 Tax=Sphingomonas sp. TaxID=28214 RepID=UPI003D6D60C8